MGQLFLKTGLSDDNISDKLIILHHHKKWMLIANTAVCFFSFTVISVMHSKKVLSWKSTTLNTFSN